ncbi:LADA_0A00474g1_1 [Lachancea dasiensis]|uniref:Ubiquitin carboxyl-terminal hydrolase n=1 Tax=Lachancea dasiensis TaxID=1072105 RepID=A0A1G4ILI3_9SACH|nr:LADA_0A00474g1_1 [Lachancea dasiensis]
MENHITPEYSDELLRYINEVYTQDIAHYFPKLRLEKLIDLLEHAEYLFESYRNALKANQRGESLLAFVVGCFYIYLIIPSSIQFNSRDKSYGIYAELKKYYNDETHMLNVLLMVTRVVESVNKQVEESAIIVRKRAYSVPHAHRVLTKEMESMTLSDNCSKSGPTLDNELDNDSIMWTAPNLNPNDHLKVSLAPLPSSTTLASDNGKVLDQAIDILSVERADKHSTVSADSQIRRGSAPANTEHKLDLKTNSEFKDIHSQDVDRYQTHRKDSYHSVYMMNDEHDSFNFNLARLQKQSVIGCEQLFKILAGDENHKVLIVDLRYAKRFQSSRIVATNIVNLDPRVLWDHEKNIPIESNTPIAQHFTKSLLNKLPTFKHIIYYTDMKTLMGLAFDYQFIFFQLFYTSSWKLNCVPEILLGGYEQWKRFVTKMAQNRQIEKEAFLFRESSKGVQKEKSHTISDLKRIPLPPSAPPPPVPSECENVRQEVSYNRAPYPLPDEASELWKANNAYQPPTSEGNLRAHHQTVLRQANSFAHFRVPTIEDSPNEYVALSVTGLRNPGNTCYINAMMQCLFATTAFKGLFLSSQYEGYFSDNYKNPNQLSKYFHLLFKKMYLNGGCSVVPTGFLKACNSLRPDLKIPSDQQDTQEFLLFLLSQLHDELSEPNHVASDYPELLLHDDEKLAVDMKEYDKWFERHISKNGISPIDKIYQGQIENALYCERCGHSSYNYSVFYVLSLAIPSTSSPFGQKKKVRLEDCINLYTSDEQLTNENAWDCPKCGSAASGQGPDDDKRKKRFLLNPDGHTRSSRSKLFNLRSKSRSRSASPFGKATAQHSNPKDWKQKKLTSIKTINFISLPSVLTIHLSRFFYDLTKKNNKVVTYPLTLSIVLKNDEVVNYRLFALVNHFGNLISGHYTSLVNKDLRHELHGDHQKWYYFDDEVVKRDKNHGDIDAGITSVSSSDVYVLFYERIRN